MSRITDITALDTLFEKKKSSSRSTIVKKEQLTICSISSLGNSSLEGFRMLCKEIEQSDAILIQGSYGSALWEVSDAVYGVLEESNQVLMFDYYRTIEFLKKDFIPNQNIYLSKFMPAVWNIGEALLMSSNGVGVGVATVPNISRQTREWFIKNTSYRSRTAIFVLTGTEQCIRNHEKHPFYHEGERSYEQYIYDNYKEVYLPAFNEGFNHVVIVLDESNGPVDLNGGLITASSVVQYYGKNYFTKLIEVK